MLSMNHRGEVQSDDQRLQLLSANRNLMLNRDSCLNPALNSVQGAETGVIFSPCVGSRLHRLPFPRYEILRKIHRAHGERRGELYSVQSPSSPAFLICPPAYNAPTLSYRKSAIREKCRLFSFLVSNPVQWTGRAGSFQGRSVLRWRSHPSVAGMRLAVRKWRRQVCTLLTAAAASEEGGQPLRSTQHFQFAIPEHSPAHLSFLRQQPPNILYRDLHLVNRPQTPPETQNSLHVYNWIKATMTTLLFQVYFSTIMGG